jgi:hypothetical protein
MTGFDRPARALDPAREPGSGLTAPAMPPTLCLPLLSGDLVILKIYL